MSQNQQTKPLISPTKLHYQVYKKEPRVAFTNEAVSVLDHTAEIYLTQLVTYAKEIHAIRKSARGDELTPEDFLIAAKIYFGQDAPSSLNLKDRAL